MSDTPRNDLTRGFAEAIADIRMKVVEEPWFGRAVTEPPRTLDIWSSVPAETPSAEPDAAEADAAAPAPAGTLQGATIAAPEGWLAAPKIGPAEPQPGAAEPDYEPDL